MKLDKHIALRYFKDDTLLYEMIGELFPNLHKEENTDKVEEAAALYMHWKHVKEDKAYYITDSVLDSKLSMLKLEKKNINGKEQYDWRVFNAMENGGYSLVLPHNAILRVQVRGDYIHFVYIHFIFSKGSATDGNLRWDMFYVNKDTGEQCTHFDSREVKSIEEFIYKLLCFVFLTDIDEVIVEAGRKYGTRKAGKIINILPVNLRYVTSRWNTDVIRTEKFGVRGHFAIRWAGKGRTTARLVFINPFEKNGYTRKAGKNI